MSNTLQNMNILIVDDNSDFVNVFTTLLRLKGFSVTAETTFKAGLRNLKNKKHHVFFLDIPLDGYDEQQILTLLQKNKIFQKTNVFLFSSIDFDLTELNKWKKNGLYSYLKKPVKRSVIINALHDVHMKINSISKPQIESIVDEQATPEQLAKLEKLEKQIQELESTPQSVPSNSDSLPKEISELKPKVTSTAEHVVDNSVLTSIVSNLKSLESKFQYVGEYTKTNNETNTSEKKL